MVQLQKKKLLVKRTDDEIEVVQEYLVTHNNLPLTFYFCPSHMASKILHQYLLVDYVNHCLPFWASADNPAELPATATD